MGSSTISEALCSFWSTCGPTVPFGALGRPIPIHAWYALACDESIREIVAPLTIDAGGCRTLMVMLVASGP